LLIRRRRTTFLGKPFRNPDRLDIGSDFLLGRPRSDGVLGGDAEVQPRPLPAAGGLRFYSFT
jgi:hypothetical protein